MDKKILIISYYLPPSPNVGGFRVWKLFVHLPAFGWKPYIISAQISGSKVAVNEQTSYITYTRSIDFSKVFSFRKIFKYRREKKGRTYTYRARVNDKIGFMKRIENAYYLIGWICGWTLFAVVSGVRIIRKMKIDVNLPAAFKPEKAYDLKITTGSHLQQSTIYTAQKVKVPE